MHVTAQLVSIPLSIFVFVAGVLIGLSAIIGRGKR